MAKKETSPFKDTVIVFNPLSWFRSNTPSLSFNRTPDTRRKHIRHTLHNAQVIVGDQTYSLQDWSYGGLSFTTAPDARIQAGDVANITIKFNFPHDTITLQQQVKIVRAVKSGVAAEFSALHAVARRQLDRVIDTMNAQSFLQSQSA